jgi:glycosyltransferase involved in cell wall biosynthesis
MDTLHLITCEFPPLIGGVSEHSRVLAQTAAARGLDVHVWSPAGGAPIEGVHVHDALGSFADADLARADQLLDQHVRPRRLIVQWVPHGYGRRGMNVAFSRWIASRAARGDELEVIVHEPFVNFAGRSWAQPIRAVVQRYMARQVLRAASRVWLSIPGWQSRLDSPWVRLPIAPRVLPVPATIPVDTDTEMIGELRAKLGGADLVRVVGYFGAGGPYAERALASIAAQLQNPESGLVLLCLGRGSDTLAARVQREVPQPNGRLIGTGTLPHALLSDYLQVCDVLVQPYEDGVSGRRTTTISALEHGLPVATTVGALSEPYWRESDAVETVPADRPASLAAAAHRLLDPERNARARIAARRLYKERFDPAVAFAPLFAD